MNWISIEDKLPDSPDFVLGTDGEVCMTVGYIPGMGFSDWNQSKCPNLNPNEVTHWMPLPKFPDGYK